MQGASTFSSQVKSASLNPDPSALDLYLAQSLCCGKQSIHVLLNLRSNLREIFVPVVVAPCQNPLHQYDLSSHHNCMLYSDHSLTAI